MIFRPIDQVGCARASSTVTCSSSARERPRNGPPEAVRTSDSTVSRIAPLEALEERRVLAVDRQQQAAAAAMGGDGELAGRDEALLVRERERDAALERPQRRLDAGEADDRVEDDVRLAGVEERGGGAADLDVLDAVRGRERRRAAACRT